MPYNNFTYPIQKMRCTVKPAGQLKMRVQSNARFGAIVALPLTQNIVSDDEHISNSRSTLTLAQVMKMGCSVLA